MLEGDILFLGQPLIEQDHGSETEQEFLLQLFQPLIQDGHRIIIKPHPREYLKKYDYIIKKYKNIHIISGIYKELPIECLIKASSINIVLAYNSSAGINIANTFKDIYVIFAFKLDIAEKVTKIRNKGLMKYDDTIFSSVYKNIFMYRSMKKICSIINSIRLNTSNNMKGNSKMIKRYDEIDIIFNKGKCNE